MVQNDELQQIKCSLENEIARIANQCSMFEPEKNMFYG
jgi:hypothetical protein